MNTELLSPPMFGVDAPHDQCWNPAESKIGSASQASLLPRVMTVELYRIKPRLDSSEGFGKWYQAVLSALEDHGLQDLINIEVPRPHRDDISAERWYCLSRQVLFFLTESVDSALAKRISESDKTCIFADEFMAALKNYMLGNGHSTAENSAFDVWEAKRSDYDTTKGFIRAMKSKLARGMENHAVKPWHAYIVVSRELAQFPGLELAVHRHNCDYDKPHSPKGFKRADFYEFCDYINKWVDEWTDERDYSSEEGM